MKLLVVLSLAAVAIGSSDWHMAFQWQRMKAMESCWGEENMKLYTVNIKKAIAKCSHEDAPELLLPPYRSSYSLVNTLLNGANKMEKQEYEMFEKLMSAMKESFGNYQSPSFKPYSNNYQMNDNNNNNWMERMSMRFRMKQMLENMMEDTSPMSYNQKNDHDFSKEDMMQVFNSMFANKRDNQMDKFRMNKPDSYSTDSYRKNDPMARMKQFMTMFSSSRSKRAAADGVNNNNLDLGDRLVEKLNEQKRQMETEIGNMTCVYKQMHFLNSDNEIDVRAIKRDVEQYEMPSPWFAQRYEEIVDTCYQMASNLPNSIQEDSVISGENFGTVNLAEVKSFMKCCSKAKTKLCMNQDIKRKVESSFGPLDDILEQTQLTESQIFPLVTELLHGKEMQYMSDY